MEDEPGTHSGSLFSRNIILLAIVLVLLIVGVGVYMVLGKKTQEQVMKKVTSQPSLTPTPAIRSLRDLLTSSASMQCDFTENDRRTIVHIKAGAVRADMTSQTVSPTPKTSQEGSFILKDGVIYFWNGKAGIKTVFDMSQIMENPSTTQKASGSADTSIETNGNTMMEALEKYRDNCKSAVVADALFVPPTDVTFQDLSKMMPSGKLMMPSGTQTSPSGISKEQMEQLQKQYIQPSR